ncbi:MAG: DoxX family protein [Gemmatimonadota bacterium]|nr:DoxX family protein [Gemmatimonadota bacterium]
MDVNNYLANGLPGYEWIAVLIARLSVGVLFAISGGGKLFVAEKRKEMQETLKKAGVPAPETMAVVLAFIEFFFGLLLALGFLTPISCVMLIGVMIGALVTTVLPGIEAKTPIAWLGEFLYLPETLYLVILFWLLLSGAGALSVDHILFTPS